MSVSLWLFVAVTGALLVWAVGATYLLLVQNPLPVRDRGNPVFSCSSDEVQAAVLSILAQNGLQPDLRADTPFAHRAIFWNRVRMILNVPSKEGAQRLGNPGAALAIVARDPAGAAEAAVRMLQERGFDAEVLKDLDPDVPPNALVFVRSTAIAGWILIFRKHITKMGKRPPRWREPV